jgi:hypothetical protein
MRRASTFVALLTAAAAVASASAEELPERAPPPDPSNGERYDGRTGRPSASPGALFIPRVLLFPFRAIFWGIEAPTRAGVEYEQRHHVYGRLYSAFTSDDGQIGVRPLFSWMRSFRPSFGAHVFHDRLLGPGTKADLDVMGGTDVVEVGVHFRPTRVGRPVQVHFDAKFDRRNDWLFTGLGAAAPVPPSTISRYLMDRLDAGARLALQRSPELALSLGGFVGFRRFGNGESLSGYAPIAEVYCVQGISGCVPNTVDERLVPGFNQGTQFLRAALGMHLDLRDALVRPTLGALVDLEADYSHGLGADDSSYFRVRGAATVDINLWRHRHILVLRGVTAVALPTGHAIVPFSELPALGGPEDLRGFLYQEFRDYSSLIATVEYRWPVLEWLDTALFFDYGGVFDRKYDGFGASRMQPDVGVALRLHSRDRFYIKLQVAYGFDDGGWQLYITGRNLP